MIRHPMQTMIHNIRKTKSCPCLLKLSLFVEISCLINLEESNYCVPPSVTGWCSSRWGQIKLSIWYTGSGKNKFLYFNWWNISECSKTLYSEIMFAIWREPRAGTPEETWAQVITRLNLEMDINKRTPWNSPIQNRFLHKNFKLIIPWKTGKTWSKNSRLLFTLSGKQSL